MAIPPNAYLGVSPNLQPPPLATTPMMPMAAPGLPAAPTNPAAGWRGGRREQLGRLGQQFPAGGLADGQQFMQWLMGLIGGGGWPGNGQGGGQGFPWQRNADAFRTRPASTAGAAPSPGFPLLQQLQAGGLGGRDPLRGGIGDGASLLSLLQSFGGRR